MNHESARVAEFDDVSLLQALQGLDGPGLDRLAFGVIGFDQAGIVTTYNAAESAASGLQREDVLGRPFFTEVAQCMNNYLVALRFEEAAATGNVLDVTIPFVLSWRMKPQQVRLRLLFSPGRDTRYLAIQRA